MIIETGYGDETYNTHTDTLSTEPPDPPDEQTVVVTVTRSSGPDEAVLVFIDTTFEPNASDGGPGLRVLVNDTEVLNASGVDRVTGGASAVDGVDRDFDDAEREYAAKAFTVAVGELRRTA